MITGVLKSSSIISKSLLKNNEKVTHILIEINETAFALYKYDILGKTCSLNKGLWIFGI